jgi:peroxiredoxin (alkyl hydroperoxide reductase subunit C)
MAVEIGQPAPGFNLLSSKMEPISLASLRGKSVLLLFFPLAFTPT